VKHDPEKHALGLRPDGRATVFRRDKRRTFALEIMLVLERVHALAGVRPGCDTDHLHRTTTEVPPHLGDVCPSQPIVFAAGDRGLLHGRFSLRQKVKTATHRVTVAGNVK
jgi:hypothetical protein